MTPLENFLKKSDKIGRGMLDEKNSKAYNQLPRS